MIGAVTTSVTVTIGLLLQPIGQRQLIVGCWTLDRFKNDPSEAAAGMPESDDASRSESTHGHGINLPPGETTWERVGRDVLAGELDERRYAVEASFRDLGGELATGSAVSVDEVRAARRAIAEAQRIIEDYVVPLVEDSEDVEPWRGAPRE